MSSSRIPSSSKTASAPNKNVSGKVPLASLFVTLGEANPPRHRR